jgi:hypothetical protein
VPPIRDAAPVQHAAAALWRCTDWRAGKPTLCSIIRCTKCNGPPPTHYPPPPPPCNVQLQYQLPKGSGRPPWLRAYLRATFHHAGSQPPAHGGDVTPFRAAT